MKRRVIRNPVSPREILAKEFLAPFGLTHKAFADHIGVETKTINRIINAHASCRKELIPSDINVGYASSTVEKSRIGF